MVHTQQYKYPGTCTPVAAVSVLKFDIYFTNVCTKV
jgi:hypothetical protein